jgi:hypothetical protein
MAGAGKAERRRGRIENEKYERRHATALDRLEHPVQSF